MHDRTRACAASKSAQGSLRLVAETRLTHACAASRRLWRSQQRGAETRRTLACAAYRSAQRSPHMMAEARQTHACAAHSLRSAQRSPRMMAEVGRTHACIDVTDLWVARLRLWDQLRWVMTVNSTLLSDKPGLKHFNFEFVILHSPRHWHEYSRTTVCSPSSGSLPPLNRVLDSPRNPSSQHIQNLKNRT